MARAKGFGGGWHKESLRHSQARRLGKATPRYSGMMTRPINKTADKIFYYESPDTNFDPKNLAIGTAIEMEHTNDPKVAKAISKAHLRESPTYYKKLIIMENKTLKQMEECEKK